MLKLVELFERIDSPKHIQNQILIRYPRFA